MLLKCGALPSKLWKCKYVNLGGQDSTILLSNQICLWVSRYSSHHFSSLRHCYGFSLTSCYITLAEQDYSVNDNNYIVWRGGFRHYPLECQRIHMWYVVKQSDLWSSFLSSPPINTITVSCEISLTFSSPYCKAKCLPACLDVVWVIWRAWTWWCWLCWLDQGIKDCSICHPPTDKEYQVWDAET